MKANRPLLSGLQGLSVRYSDPNRRRSVSDPRIRIVSLRFFKISIATILAMIHTRCAFGFVVHFGRISRHSTIQHGQLLTMRTRTRNRSFLTSVSPDASSEAINDSKQKAQQQQQKHRQQQYASLSSSNNRVFDRFCDLELPEGRCVGLTLREFHANDPDADALSLESIGNNASHWIHPLLDPQEIAYGMTLPSDVRRETFFIGRLAMRDALGLPPIKTGMDDTGIPAILKDEHGRPTMPKGYLGSISHKDRTGVGLVAKDETYSSPGDPPKFGIGIDLERTASNRRSVAKKILTEMEIDGLGRLLGITADEEVLLRFSLKESIYKSVHPLLNQYIGFQEAEVTPFADGTASVTWSLKSGAHERLGDVSAHWRRLPCGEYFLTSSAAYLKDEEDR